MPPDPSPTVSTDDTILGIPINRIVLIMMPIISPLVGGLVDWAFTNLHFLATFHLDESGATKSIIGAVVWLVATLVTAASHLSFIKGHHIQLANITPDVIAVTGQGGQVLDAPTEPLTDDATDEDVAAAGEGFEPESDNADGADEVPPDFAEINEPGPAKGAPQGGQD